MCLLCTEVINYGHELVEMAKYHIGFTDYVGCLSYLLPDHMKNLFGHVWDDHIASFDSGSDGLDVKGQFDFLFIDSIHDLHVTLQRRIRSHFSH